MDLSVTPVYVAILAILFIPFTAYVGVYRGKSKIFLGDGNDPEMLRRMRAQANFVESVPLALIVLLTVEVTGASSTLLHILGSMLVIGRLSHYLQMVGVLQSLGFRAGGMLLTLAVYLAGAIAIILQIL